MLHFPQTLAREHWPQLGPELHSTRRKRRSRQGYYGRLKSSGIVRYRSELSASKPVILLPNRQRTRLHTTVTTAATQPHHNHTSPSL
ncbi:hypothetical protein VTJ04DRAFT_6200 [Mycothermus thermophilus]|uniref:uncharacterized protein n=1 Tax=Humicola insolens TaxID=85995 RepID=UPI00374250DA